MRVYGGTFFYGTCGQVRGIIAGTQKQAATATKAGLSYIREYWIVTRNEIDLRVALAQPGVLFWHDNKSYVRKETDYQQVAWENV